MADINDMRKNFYTQRRADVERQARGSQQEGEDALKRRFTSLGSAGSGAELTLQAKAREQGDLARSQAINEVSGQEASIMAQENEADTQRKFASSESDKQRKLAGDDMGFKREIFQAEQGNKLREFDLAQKQFEMDKDTTEFNKRLAEGSLTGIKIYDPNSMPQNFNPMNPNLGGGNEYGSGNQNYNSLMGSGYSREEFGKSPQAMLYGGDYTRAVADWLKSPHVPANIKSTLQAEMDRLSATSPKTKTPVTLDKATQDINNTVSSM